MKKQLCAILLSVCLLLLLTGCDASKSNPSGDSSIPAQIVSGTPDGSSKEDSNSNDSDTAATPSAIAQAKTVQKSGVAGNAAQGGSVNPQTADTTLLTYAKEQAIKQDYCNYLLKTKATKALLKVTDIHIDACYGAFANYEVVKLSELGKAFTSALAYDQMGQFVFIRPGSQPVYVHQNGSFIEWTQAYQKGIITKADVQKLYAGFPAKYKAMADTTLFTYEQEQVVKQEYVDYLKRAEGNSFSCGAEDITIRGCYGAYKTCQLLIMRVANVNSADAVAPIKVGKYEFNFSSGAVIPCVRDSKNSQGVFYGFKEAYTRGILTDEMLEQMYNAYFKGRETGRIPA